MATKKTYRIKGMHCASCAATIQLILGKEQAIKNAVANYANEKLYVEYDEKQISEQDISKKVKSMGYELVSQDGEKSKEGVQTIEFVVLGMDSPHCANVVSSVLKKQKGIANIDLNFNTQKAKLTFDSRQISKETIFSLIEQSGYKPQDIDNQKEEQARREVRLKNKLMTGSVLSVLVVLLAYVPFSFSQNTNVLLQFLLTSPIQWYVGWEFYSGLTLFFKFRQANMYTLISIGTLAAYFYSLFTVINRFFPLTVLVNDMPYFDVSAVVITLVLLGKYLEEKTKGKTQEAIKKLVGLSAKTAVIERNGKHVEVPLQEINVGDIMIVKPGEKIPTDGIIVVGEGEIDQSMITGEPIPALKRTGEGVFGATINVSDIVLKVKAEKVGEKTLLSRIIRLVEEAQSTKVPIQNLADSISAVFVPAVLIIAAITFGAWFFFGPEPQITWALLSTIAVLIVACPCALGLATPTALVTAIGRAAKDGILVKKGEALQLLPKAKTFVFDKTGTITEGKPEIIQLKIKNEKLKIETQEFINLVASIEKESHHPIAKAIVKRASETYPTEQVKTMVGLGIVGEIKNSKLKIQNYNAKVKIIIGNKKLMEKNGVKVAGEILKETEERQAEGETVIFVGGIFDTPEFLGYISLADKEKQGAKDLISFLKKRNIRTILLTGDKKETAFVVGKRVGFAEGEIIAEVLPTEKQDIIAKLKAEKSGGIVMIGDGINDAAALSSADVSIAMGQGSDVAIEAGDFVIVAGDVKRIQDAYKLSRKTFAIIYQNFFWAFGYNIILIPAAAGVLYPFFNITFNPIWAGFAMAFSSVSVVTNSLRIRS